MAIASLSLPGAVLAADCVEQIVAAERLITEAGDKIEALPEKEQRLALSFLNDASKLLITPSPRATMPRTTSTAPSLPAG